MDTEHILSDADAWESVLENEALIKHVIKKHYMWMIYHNGILEFNDLFTMGMIGVLQAVKRYSPKKGKFSGYATIWIKQSIQRGFENDYWRDVKVPIYSRSKAREAVKKYGRDADYDKLIKEKKVKPTTFDAINALYPNSKLELDALSEESILHTDKDFFEDICNKDDINYSAEAVSCYFKCLNDREITVIRKRYGFDGDSLTLEVVSGIIGVTRERARQIEEKALIKLKKYSKIKEQKMEKIPCTKTENHPDNVDKKKTKFANLERLRALYEETPALRVTDAAHALKVSVATINVWKREAGLVKSRGPRTTHVLSNTASVFGEPSIQNLIKGIDSLRDFANLVVDETRRRVSEIV